MSSSLRLVIVSDIHYAGPRERERAGKISGDRTRPWQRMLVRAYRKYFWLADPFEHNGLLDQFLAAAGDPDWVVANGDYACDSAYLGMMDEEAFESASLSVGLLRARFGDRLRLVLGDHEIGKRSLTGNYGGLRMASLDRAVGELGIPEFWTRTQGPWTLIGVNSTLLAFPVFREESLAEEGSEWESRRRAHFERISSAFDALDRSQRVILFCHDPSALPFLLGSGAVRERLGQLERTVIGHLHSPLIFRKSRLLAGMPRIDFLGATAKRLSRALREGRCWSRFRVQLCPSLTGVQLLKDGGFYTANLDLEGRDPLRLEFQPLEWIPKIV
ncbi:MAG: metallophosphoesterase [Verrucomicrobia bacterium]|nr:metallophosphoesterase [Verrucomicrobiota bacterium]MBI3867532.1 metallophosphoesterase [Verrucomicrobiota bacterium]